MLADAGFVGTRIHGWTSYHPSLCTEGALVSARQPLSGKQAELVIILAALILGEPLTWKVALGGALVVAGVPIFGAS